MKTISSISSWSDHFREARCCTKERRSATSMAARLFFGARSMRFYSQHKWDHHPSLCPSYLEDSHGDAHDLFFHRGFGDLHQCWDHIVFSRFKQRDE
jgi:hypothetical protein